MMKIHRATVCSVMPANALFHAVGNKLLCPDYVMPAAFSPRHCHYHSRDTMRTLRPGCFFWLFMWTIIFNGGEITLVNQKLLRLEERGRLKQKSLFVILKSLSNGKCWKWSMESAACCLQTHVKKLWEVLIEYTMKMLLHSRCFAVLLEEQI